MFAACGVEEESKIGRVAVVELLLLKFCFSAGAAVGLLTWNVSKVVINRRWRTFEFTGLARLYAQGSVE